jgi:hypothetical protein
VRTAADLANAIEVISVEAVCYMNDKGEDWFTVAEAEVNLPWLLVCKALINRIARHCKCTPEDAKLRVIRKGKAGRLGARGLIAEKSNIRHVSALSKTNSIASRCAPRVRLARSDRLRPRVAAFG